MKIPNGKSRTGSERENPALGAGAEGQSPVGGWEALGNLSPTKGLGARGMLHAVHGGVLESVGLTLSTVPGCLKGVGKHLNEILNFSLKNQCKRHKKNT